jgi:transposase
MMGTKARAFAALPPMALEDLVPPDHFYRHLERTLDLGFVRDLVREAYADIGRPSIDPVVFFKLQLILFFESLRSERQLMRVVADRLSLRWYLGYDLTEPLPDHSSLTRIRERYGLAIFRRFFEAVVEQCLAAGLVWGEELYLDATKVAANAATDSLRPRFAVEAHLARLFASEEDGDGTDRTDDPGGTGGEAPARLPIDLTDAARSQLADCAAQRHDWLGSAGRPDRTETSGTYRRTADFRVSTTDPDATPLPYGERGTRLGYQDHYVVDGGRARIILTALVAPAEVQENQPALDLLATPNTAPSRTSPLSRGRASTPIFRCPRPVAAPVALPRLISSMTWRPIPTTVPGARACGSSPSARRPGDACMKPLPRPAPPVRSGRGAPPRSAAGAWDAVWRRPPWTACAATTRRNPTPRRCASGKSGSSRCSPKPRSGTDYDSFAYGGWRTSTARRC